MIIEIDKQGRIVIPKFVRETLSIEPNSNIKLELEGKKLIITKSE